MIRAKRRAVGTRLGLRSVSALMVGLVGLACSEPEEPDAYTASGVVRQIDKEVYIAHEAIPEFRDSQGEIVGMEAMSMPFVLASPELAEGITAGSRISFDFLVRWRSSPALEVIAIRKLPDDTPIELRATPPDSPAEP